MGSMSDIEKVVLASKRLEGLLRKQHGATGKGLHELTEDAKDLPKQAVKKLHYVATLRNKVIHEEGYDHLDDPKSFDRAVGELEKILSVGGENSGKTGCFGRLMYLLMAIFIIAVAYLMFLR